MLLSELDGLPTLSAVAIRLLELTNDSDSDSEEVINLVSSDPTLAARVLAMCRCHPRGRANNVTTIDRAVLMVGFDTVRSAVLAVEVFDLLDGMSARSGEKFGDAPAFDREAFWLHSIAVAAIAEQLATRSSNGGMITRGEAFMAGILHDLGQLVLHVLLPESFDRVCRIAETHTASLDRACRQLIGLDTHTAGKKLAEHWGLSQDLVDVVWLTGQPFEALPKSSNRTLIATISLADAMVRGQYITPGAEWARAEDFGKLARPVGIEPHVLEDIMGEVHEHVTERAGALGLDVATDNRVLLRAISRANRSLARANAGMRRREHLAKLQGVLVEAMGGFLKRVQSTSPIADVIGAIGVTGGTILGGTVIGAIYEAPGERRWRFVNLGSDGLPSAIRTVETPEDAFAPTSTMIESAGTPVAAILPWLMPLLDVDPDDPDIVSWPLTGTEGTRALLILSRDGEPAAGPRDLAPLVALWSSALGASAEHEFAAQITEQLAQANRALQEMQDVISRQQSMATLGEVAAGAAHEMNNPLTVISGRSQILATRLKDPSLNQTAQEISQQAKRLSGMISALRTFAEPIVTQPEKIDLPHFVSHMLTACGPFDDQKIQINTVFANGLVPASFDVKLMSEALAELIRNACESASCRHVEIRVSVDPLDGALRVDVRDDGAGLSDHALRHAFDPFFSDKPAGRQPGLGLARANRYVEAHGGHISLVNRSGGGAVATIWIPKWKADSVAPQIARHRV